MNSKNKLLMEINNLNMWLREKIVFNFGKVEIRITPTGEKQKPGKIFLPYQLNSSANTEMHYDTQVFIDGRLYVRFQGNMFNSKVKLRGIIERISNDYFDNGEEEVKTNDQIISKKFLNEMFPDKNDSGLSKRNSKKVESKEISDDYSWYNIDLDKDSAQELKTFLKNNNIYFEPSSNYDLIHFEIKIDNNDVKEMIKKYLSEKSNNSTKDSEPASDYNYVVYLWPFAGYQTYPFYVNSDSDYYGTIIALAVKQAIENGQKNFYYTEEELEDLTDEEKDSNYIYFDMSEFGLPNVYIDSYNTKVYTKEEDPNKAEEKKAEAEHPIEDSKCKDGEEELYTENLFGEKVNLPKYLEEKGIDFTEEQHNGKTVVYPKPKEEDYEAYKYEQKGEWDYNLWIKGMGAYEKAQYKLFEEIKKDFPNLKTYDYYTGTITIFGFILPEDEVKIGDSFEEEWNFEGWYVKDIIEELTPEFEMIEEGNANRSKFKTVGDLKSWIKEQYPLNNATKVLGYNSAVSLVLRHFSERVMNEFGGYTDFPVKDTKKLKDSFKVEFFVEGNLLEGQTEEGFETYREAEEYAEDQIAVISQNGTEKEIPLENIEYEINYIYNNEEE